MASLYSLCLDRKREFDKETCDATKRIGLSPEKNDDVSGKWGYQPMFKLIKLIFSSKLDVGIC